MVLMASPAVNLPLWTQEGGRTGRVDQFPPGTEVPGLGYLGNGVGGGEVGKQRQAGLLCSGKYPSPESASGTCLAVRSPYNRGGSHFTSL